MSPPTSTTQEKRPSGNIILVGMMGAGKTTVGKILAMKLGKDFLDSDSEIQRRTGVSIPHIFDIEGEAGFRQREISVIQELVKRNNIVLATGGGAVMDEKNQAAMQCNGTVVYLESAAHDLWQRLRHDSNRPLLQIADPYAKLQELYALRSPIYAQIADVVVHTGKQSVKRLVAQLQLELNRLNTVEQVTGQHGD